ncbi:hypothetical protein LTH96_12740 [Nesterenkonia sp. LB17]|uniref:hypothetical protein n=1 Tax=unclassified Nesterenkonia TaxID=2629769 RepID=UPI001F4CA9E6|nr:MULTISPECIES: hypothetical protein [unclassified Nesterenkonia]MCH8561028.1 hypothetical protein [Nesterenkonia sp. DZ6]MCH8563362.1 hypothetical protein [Nesterenkonia sp. YGD6]MCH8566581.1 hypothetical protein [Nesterenkonia sp. LB17]MCH8571104.1 hypothetical protein [Nesterenkonia sp. AY15]
MENFWTYFEVLAPSIGVGLVFWLAIRAIFRADRNERAAEIQVREEASQQGVQRDEPTSGPHS